MNKNFLLPISIVVAGLIIAGGIYYVNQGKAANQNMDQAETQFLSQSEAAVLAIDFINKSLASEGVTTTADLLEATTTDSVYQIRFKIEENEYTAFVSKAGKYLFPTAYELAKNNSDTNSGDSNNNQQGNTCETLSKADSPVFDAFVVSQCPYGLQMQRVLAEVVKNIPSLAQNIKVRYIGAVQDNKITSMHGDVEAQENLRQICIREEQVNKYWNYVSCYMQAGNTDACLTSSGVDKTKLSSCMTDVAKGLKYAQQDFNLQNQRDVSGSPTLFINGKQVAESNFGGRTADALKTIICCGFNQEPSFCSQTLNTNSAGTGFSSTYEGSGGSSSGGCN
ncbi:MAG: hypothetical protein PHF44_00160 [Candidatus Pacebacteria bacterium]|nr:hypothetical protein [Candidatus Paceibacterota bacterium]